VSPVSRPYSNWEGLPELWSPLDALFDIKQTLEDSDNETQQAIAEVGVALTHLLLLKNRRYGDSALKPLDIFARNMTPRERMAVRMDDKLNRIRNGLGANGGDGEHPAIDLAGYLLLDVIAGWRE
jgi:hypothetical protein